MKERPILFSGDMVRAILDGRKTQTRRTVNPSWRGAIVKSYCCPYGVPGDRLWVQEDWGVGCRPCPINGWVDGIEYRADEAYCIDEHDDLPLNPVKTPDGVDLEDFNSDGWSDAKTMPRWASRITLEITGVRVERVQDISEEDASTEGVEWKNMCDWPHSKAFKTLWDSIAKPGVKWEDNPWVWVIEFRRVENEEK